LGRIVFLEGDKKIYGIVLETDYGEGVVRKLSEVAESKGVVSRFIQVSMAKPSEKLAKTIVFLDFSNASIKPEEALRLVRRQPFVKNAYLITPNSKGILYDNYFFPLVVGGKRAVIFRRRVYESLFKGIRERFGTAGEAMLYYQGFTIGQRMRQAYREEHGLKNPKELTELLMIDAKTLGWGILEFAEINLEEGEAQIRVYQSFECEIGKGSEAPYGHFIRGILAGFFTDIFGEEAKAVETKCIAKGDPYCEYTIKRVRPA
jgi:predicted hydrocarbon binding protein